MTQFLQSSVTRPTLTDLAAVIESDGVSIAPSCFASWRVGRNLGKALAEIAALDDEPASPVHDLDAVERDFERQFKRELEALAGELES